MGRTPLSLCTHNSRWGGDEQKMREPEARRKKSGKKCIHAKNPGTICGIWQPTTKVCICMPILPIKEPTKESSVATAANCDVNNNPNRRKYERVTMFIICFDRHARF